MVAWLRNHTPPPKQDNDNGPLLVTMTNASGAVLRQETCADGKHAGRTAALMIAGRGPCDRATGCA
jgi:hypothetical protein